MTDHELDVRALRKPDKHPAIFRTYDDLAVGESFVLVNDHDPRHLRDELEIDHPRSHGWEYLDKGPETWRIRITKLASTALPRILCDTTTLTVSGDADAMGAIWRLPVRERDLDSNIIQIAPSNSIEAHTGPDLDVLIHVLRGSGRLTTEVDSIAIAAGDLLWLPRRSQRQFTAGLEGLTYLTVHQRRQALTLAAPPRKTEH